MAIKQKKHSKQHQPAQSFVIEPHLFFTLAVLLSICGIVAVLLTTGHYGPGLTTDSVYYVSSARNLAQGDGFVSFDGTPMLSWPPLYPMVLSVSAFLGGDVIEFARWFNALLFCLIILLTITITEKIYGSRLCALIAGLLMLFSGTVLNVSINIWSEALFIALILLATIFAHKIAVSEKTETKHVILFGTATAMACLTRYAGVAVYLAGVLFLMILASASLKKKLYLVTIYSAFSLLPIAIWLARNIILHGSMTGPRTPGTAGFFENIVLVIRQTAFALFYNSSIGVIALVLAALFAGIFGWKIFRKSGKWSFILLFIAVYIAFLIVTSSLVSFDAINDRLLSPIVPFVIIAIVCALVEGGKSLNKNLRIVLMLSLLVWAVNSIVFTTKFVNLSRTRGVGFYSLKMFRESPLLKRVIEVRPTGRIFSNFPDLLYIKADVEALWTPMADGSRRELLEDIEAGKRINIIWFYYSWGRTVNITEFLALNDEITIHEAFRDGWIGTYPADRRIEPSE